MTNRTRLLLTGFTLGMALAGCSSSPSSVLDSEEGCSDKKEAFISFQKSSRDSTGIQSDGDYEFRLKLGTVTESCRAKIVLGEASASPCSAEGYAVTLLNLRTVVVGDAVTAGPPSEIGWIRISQFGVRAPDLAVYRNGKLIFSEEGPEWASLPPQDCPNPVWYVALPSIADGGGGGAGGAN